MTTLTGDAKIICRTQTLVKGRPVVVELHPRYLRFRLLGSRESYTMSLEAAFDRAAQNAAKLAALEGKR